MGYLKQVRPEYTVVGQGDVQDNDVLAIEDTSDTSENPLGFSRWIQLSTLFDSYFAPRIGQGQNGNILYVAPINSDSSDLRTRAEAIGRDSKPFSTLDAAINISLDGDIIVCYNVTGSVNSTHIGARFFLVDNTCNFTFIQNNAGFGSISKFISRDKGGSVTLSTTGGNNTVFEVYDIPTVTVTTRNDTNVGLCKYVNINALSFDPTFRIQADIERCTVNQLVSTNNCIVNIKDSTVNGNISQTSAGAGQLNATVDRCVINGYISAATRNIVHFIRTKRSRLNTTTLPAIRTTDTNNIKVIVEDCILRSDTGVNSINISSTIPVSVDVSLFNVLRTGAVVATGTGAPTLNIITQINNNLITTAQADEFLI